MNVIESAGLLKSDGELCQERKRVRKKESERKTEG